MSPSRSLVRSKLCNPPFSLMVRLGERSFNNQVGDSNHRFGLERITEIELIGETYKGEFFGGGGKVGLSH